jgi:hypothetical protein
MADGAWIVLAGVTGATGSIITTWLNARLNRQTAYPTFDRAANKALTALLKEGPQRLGVFVNVVGMTPKDTKEYLVCLGARGSKTDGDLWGYPESKLH